jgi:hypothetical protein
VESYNVTGIVTIVSHTMTPPPLPDGEYYTVELGESMPVENLGLAIHAAQRHALLHLG